MNDVVPDDVIGFLTYAIETYEELEVLLLLRECAGAALTRDRIGEHLGLDSASVAWALAQLTAHDLVEECDSTFRYGPLPAARAETVGRLAAAYGDDRRLEIVKQLTANAMQRVRHDVRAFAAAHVLGKDKKDG